MALLWMCSSTQNALHMYSRYLALRKEIRASQKTRGGKKANLRPALMCVSIGWLVISNNIISTAPNSKQTNNYIVCFYNSFKNANHLYNNIITTAKCQNLVQGKLVENHSGITPK